MKVCMLAPEFPPAWGGVGIYVYELARRMPAEVEFHVLTPLREAIDRIRVSSDDYDFFKNLGDNVRIHFISKASDTFLYNASFQYACMRCVPKLIRQEKIDFIHSHTAHMPDILVAFRHLKIPILTTIHTTIKGQQEGTRMSGAPFDALSRSEKMTFFLYPFLRFAEEAYFQRKRTYITQSVWMKDQIIARYKHLRSSIEVVPTSVDTDLFQPNSRKKTNRDEAIILFTGRLLAAKGVSHIVEAIPKVISNHPDVKFLFIGPGDAAGYERRLVEMHVSRRNFSFLGYLKNAEDLAEYYGAADIYLAPTLYENLPARILEAMACESPVIASNVCGIPEAIEDGYNGVLIPPRSSQRLAEAICYLLENQGEAKRIGKNARQTVEERFSYKVNIPKVLEMYEKVAG
jgi:glycosyltransferase involved in cell wall biosynthesis